MKKWIKRAFRLVLLLILGYLLYQYEMVIYGVRQGVGQAKILLNTRSVEEVLADSTFPDSLKQKIHFIQEVREFAVNELGLVNSENYTTLFNQKGEPVLWVVSACEPYSLNEHQWDYPFLGALGYKGFFKPELAQKEAKELKKQGFDVSVGTVSAWSTLGFFKDPILSNMLLREEGDLAELIIHELTHATLFVKGDATFNENLATFIGKRGAEQYLLSRNPILETNNALQSYLNKENDKDIYVQFLIESTQKLKTFYAELNKEGELETTDSLNALKYNEIERLLSFADTLPLSNKDRYLFIREKDTLPNNTYFTGYAMYRSAQDSLETLYKTEYNTDLKAFLAGMKNQYGTSEVNR